MGQTANTIPPSGIGTLHLNDFFKGLIKTVSGLLIGLIVKTIQDKHLPPYSEVAPLLEASVYFIFAYLGLNAATNNVGQLFTKDAPTTTVSAEKLEEVVAKANEPKAVDATK